MRCVLVGSSEHDFYFPFHIWDVIRSPLTNSYFFRVVGLKPPTSFNVDYELTHSFFEDMFKQDFMRWDRRMFLTFVHMKEEHLVMDTLYDSCEKLWESLK